MATKNYLKTDPIAKEIDKIRVGDTFQVSESFRPQDILLYMGVTGDTNPHYLGQIQKNEDESVKNYGFVPIIAVMGVLTRTVSMHFPGANNAIVEFNYSQSKAIEIGSTVTFSFEVVRKEEWRSMLMIHVTGLNEKTGEDNILDAMLSVLVFDEDGKTTSENIDEAAQRNSSANEYTDHIEEAHHNHDDN
ncbi:MAG: dehydrogenase [Aerococcus sp.]|nr:dehydrogenase [Aerococcus sp.]